MPDLSSPLARPFFFPEGEHAVLLMHGFTGSPAHMRKLGEALHARGFAVRGILLPGHGGVPEDVRGVRWQDWLLAARSSKDSWYSLAAWSEAAMTVCRLSCWRARYSSSVSSGLWVLESVVCEGSVSNSSNVVLVATHLWRRASVGSLLQNSALLA